MNCQDYSLPSAGKFGRFALIETLIRLFYVCSFRDISVVCGVLLSPPESWFLHSCETSIRPTSPIFSILCITSPYLLLTCQTLYSHANYNQLMDDLTPEQYQTVLTLMQTTGEDNFQTAAQLLKTTHFQLQSAIDIAMGRRQQAPQNKPVRRMRDEDFIRRYQRYLERKDDEWSLMGSLFGGIRQAFAFCFRLIGRLLLPRYLALKWLYSPFYRLYANSLLLPFKQASLKSLLLRTRNISPNPVLLAVSTGNVDQILLDLLNMQDIKAVVSRNFMFKGLTQGDKELQMVQGAEAGPQIIICRMNLMEEVEVITKFVGEDELKDLTAATLLDIYEKSRKLCRADRNNLVKYYNWRSRHNSDGLLPEETDSQIDAALPPLQRITTTEQIKQQNEVYHQLEEEERRKQNQMAIKQQELQEKEEIRQIRKMSLPVEPVEGDVIRVSFRCPNGNTLVRSFNTDEKVELLFDWVELNDDISFEDPERKFELMFSYPPQPLSPYKHQQLCQTFDTSHQKLLIREL